MFIDPDDTPIDPELLASLEREAPILSRLTRFARGLDGTRWFAHLGEKPSARMREMSQAYLDALGFPDASLSILPTWDDAADAAETFDYASPAWEAEELLRADLTGDALSAVSEEALTIGLSVVARAVGDAAREAMEQQAAYWDMADAAAQNLAVGAAAQATHGAGLLLVAAAANPLVEVDGHPIALKFSLFEQGRWPVALIGGTFSVF